MQLHFAPIQGYTDTVYLTEFAKWYEPLDMCYTPFIRIEKGEPRRQDMARLAAFQSGDFALTPQIIFKDATEFLKLSDSIKALGFTSIDLNLGCPYPMQTRKGRGAAMVANPAAMSEVCSIISRDTSTAYSIKMRLGIDSPDQWRDLMPLLNDTPLRHITLHPRTASQMYAGEIDSENVSAFISACHHPVIYNGDLNMPADIDMIMEKHRQLAGVMIGRGLLSRPSLAIEWKSGEEWTFERRIARQKEFYAALMRAYSSRLCGDTQILQKMKPYWAFLEPEIGHKAAKAIAKATTMAQYEKAVSSIPC